MKAKVLVRTLDMERDEWLEWALTKARQFKTKERKGGKNDDVRCLWQTD